MKEVLLQDFLHVLLRVIITPILAEVKSKNKCPSTSKCVEEQPKRLIKSKHTKTNMVRTEPKACRSR
jgi:hypothetical protein